MKLQLSNRLKRRPDLGHWQPIVWIGLATGLLYIYSMLPGLVATGYLRLVGPITRFMLLYSVATGLVVWLAVCYLDPWLAQRPKSNLTSRLVFGILGVLAGIEIITYLIYLCWFPAVIGQQVAARGLYDVTYRACSISAIVYGWIVFSRHTEHRQTAARSLADETMQLETDLQLTELALLDAQIEPHFLFNTLAYVKRQYRVNEVAASEVMYALTQYLHRAAPALRQDNWNLGQEIELVDLYLNILAHRFGARLQHQIVLPAECAEARVPALVLATLVENSVRHGITPKAEGGTVWLEVRQEGTKLQIIITDDGVGLRQTSGSGLGLSTVKARLHSAFGDQASVMVEPNQPCGVRATLCFPLQILHQGETHES